jgi:probable HAF family extracellular repeat protein
MKYPRGLFVVLTALLCASSLPALAEPGYRLVPLDDGSARTAVFDLNRRGELVGMRSVAGETHAFRWRSGTFTDLHGAIDPASTFTQAAGINDRSAIVGVNLVGDSFRGFLLRGTRVDPITVVVGETQVFPFDINNRGQILVDSLGGAQSGSFLIDGANVQRLEGLPGETDSMHALAINERGVIAGNTRTAAGNRAVLWQEGTIMNLGVAPGELCQCSQRSQPRGRFRQHRRRIARHALARRRDGIVAAAAGRSCQQRREHQQLGHDRRWYDDVAA